jgi:hypothetical protein
MRFLPSNEDFEEGAVRFLGVAKESFVLAVAVPLRFWTGFELGAVFLRAADEWFEADCGLEDTVLFDDGFLEAEEEVVRLCPELVLPGRFLFCSEEDL